MTATDLAIQKKFNFRGRRRNLPWYPRHGKRKHLAELFCTLGFTEGVEVGTQRGIFAKVLCENNPQLHLSCVDPWSSPNEKVQKAHNEKYAIALQNLNDHNVSIIRKASMDAVGDFKDKSLDFVYIDGDHSFESCILDILHWTKKVKSGGIVAAHDYHPFVGIDVILAVNAYTRANHIDPWYVTREPEITAYWVQQ